MSIINIKLLAKYERKVPVTHSTAPVIATHLILYFVPMIVENGAEIDKLELVANKR